MGGRNAVDGIGAKSGGCNFGLGKSGRQCACSHIVNGLSLIHISEPTRLRCISYAVFTSFADPVNKVAMRNQRLEAVSLPDYIPKSGRHNNWGFNLSLIHI